jgi:hypothetical protein
MRIACEAHTLRMVDAQGTSYGSGTGGGHCSFQISEAATQPWITGINYYVGTHNNACRRWV